LRAQRVDKSSGKPYCGWHSENVVDPDQIHLWLTSEVIVFLLTYQLRCHQAIAHSMLKASGLQVKRDTTHQRPREMSPGTYWKEGPERKPTKGWLWNEPLMGHPFLDSPYLIYDVILKNYLEPRDPAGQDRGSRAYSMLLYGPPGTGKTTVCEEMAKALGWQFVTVTPSDFLAGGSRGVSAR
jgi:ATPase family protein associated with various cellular activities (AAA)